MSHPARLSNPSRSRGAVIAGLLLAVGLGAARAMDESTEADSDPEAGLADDDAWFARAEKVQHLMEDGLHHELFGRYAEAEKAYKAASEVDPTDPVPFRFLGELYRHHIGRWDLAHEEFQKILDMGEKADAFSRAIATHGIGKMTIFSNKFEKGVKMIEASTRIHPTQLAYRNLAVFWNSEGYFEKARGYAKKALDLAPQDPYTKVYWATLLAQNGQHAEALAIVESTKLDPSMSYNLASIYAECGDIERGIEYLRRHFFEFESNDAVRWYETQEARSDYALRKLHDHPEFVAMAHAEMETPVGAPELGPPDFYESEAWKRMAERANERDEKSGPKRD